MIDDNVIALVNKCGFFEQPRSRSSDSRSLWSVITNMRAHNIRVDRLRPRDASTARANTLSANYETAAFPPHTDFALQTLPARYIALFCPVSRPGGTTLFSGERFANSPSGTFRISTRVRSYSATFTNRNRLGTFYRYNADLMHPLDEDARHFAETISLADPNHIVYWERVAWVIIDNWAYLHGRQPVPQKTGWLWRIALDLKA